MRLKCTPLILLFLVSFFSSCIDNANFDQIDLNAEPTFEAPLVFFELDQLDFLDDVGNVEIQAITDITDLDFFESSTFRNDLRRADFLFEIRNTFDRRFGILIQLVDNNNNVTYTFDDFNIPTSGDNFLEFRENIIIADNPSVLNTSRVRVTITLLPGTSPIDPDVEQKVVFKSAGIFYLRL